MPRNLDESDFSTLRAHVDAGAREQYYNHLKNAGFGEAAWSLAVVRDQGFIARFANRYAEKKAHKADLKPTHVEWQRIGVALMAEDYGFRRRLYASGGRPSARGGPPEFWLGYQEYSAYHGPIFRRHLSLPLTAWAPALLLQGIASDRVEDVWNRLRDAGTMNDSDGAALINMAVDGLKNIPALASEIPDIVSTIAQMLRDTENFYSSTRARPSATAPGPRP